MKTLAIAMLGTGLALSSACSKSEQKKDTATTDTPAKKPETAATGAAGKAGAKKEMPKQVSVSGGTLCTDTAKFALCTTAECKPDPADGTKMVCECNVASGPNWGKSSCESRVLKENSLVATFSTQEAGPPLYSKVLKCPHETMLGKKDPAVKAWADCLDAPCTLNSDRPTKATCSCKASTATPWGTLGGACQAAGCDKHYAGFAHRPGNAVSNRGTVQEAERSRFELPVLHVQLVTCLRDPLQNSSALAAARRRDRPSAYLLEYALHVLRRCTALRAPRLRRGRRPPFKAPLRSKLHSVDLCTPARTAERRRWLADFLHESLFEVTSGSRAEPAPRAPSPESPRLPGRARSGPGSP